LSLKRVFVAAIASERAMSHLAARQNPSGGFNVAAGGKPHSEVRGSTQVLGGLAGRWCGTLRSGRVHGGR
jgi:hypothetical protein